MWLLFKNNLPEHTYLVIFMHHNTQWVLCCQEIAHYLQCSPKWYFSSLIQLSKTALFLYSLQIFMTAKHKSVIITSFFQPNKSSSPLKSYKNLSGTLIVNVLYRLSTKKSFFIISKLFTQELNATVICMALAPGFCTSLKLRLEFVYICVVSPLFFACVNLPLIQ